MHPFARRLSTFGAALVVASTPTLAMADAGGSSGWEPSATPSFDLAAGESCSFGLQAEVLYDHELTRIVATFPDGSPRVVDVQGSLGFEFTNVGTGESLRRDVSGTLEATIHEDGSIDFQFGGNGLAVIRTSAPDSEPGVYVISGPVLYVAHADGSREFTDQHGTIENICQTLG